MKQSESIKELAMALSKFQGEITNVTKDATVQTAKYSYKYAGLPTVIEHIKPEMLKYELSIVQAAEPLMDDGHLVMETMLLHSSGEWVSGFTPIKLVNDDPQGVGSAITYARRYGLCAILGIASDEDDDGQLAQERQAKTNVPEKKAPKKTPPEKNVKNTSATTSPIKRDLSTLKTLTDMQKAAFQDFNVQPAAQLKELGYNSWNEVVDSPEDCYLKIKAVYNKD